MTSAKVATEEEVVNGLYLIFGLSLGFAAEFWSGMGAIQIKYSHKLDAISSEPRPVYKRPRWWLGFGLFILNIVFNFASYMFASLNILAPTSSLLIVVNIILARIYFDEKLTLLGLIGSILIMVGCVVSIIFGTHSQDELKVDNLFSKAYSYQFILFTTIHGFLCIVFGIIGSVVLRDKPTTITSPKGSQHSHLYNAPNRDDIANADQSEVQRINLVENDSVSGDREQDDHHDPEIDEEDEKMQQLPAQQRRKNSNDAPLVINDEIPFSSTSANERSAIIPKSIEQRRTVQKAEWKHIIRCFLLAFATAGVMAWAQFMGKIVADLFYESIWHGNNQFDGTRSWAVMFILGLLLLSALYMMSEIMRIFDAVLIIPVYSSLMICTAVALSGVYWNNFRAWSVKDSLLFSFGLLLILSGIVTVSQGQKHASMVHHEHDKRQYVENHGAQDSGDW
eukprot:CAMPEP_0197071946 /NCGR_PEP_ID=MMETSP1384-20130603/209822_1 /TAXON_ID=29189 /ORGANISM="Ammonia sp." /LENGTH=450 /DNA_ID=CAMNT_0042510753 /DNA_START=21 /DNA_END=1370 /DNA_ORIENTATION=+